MPRNIVSLFKRFGKQVFQYGLKQPEKTIAVSAARQNTKRQNPMTTKDKESLITILKPTLTFYFVVTIFLLVLYFNYRLPNYADIPSIYQLALIGQLFISAFLGFKNAMSSKKTSNLIVLIHTVALLIIIAILAV